MLIMVRRRRRRKRRGDDIMKVSTDISNVMKRKSMKACIIWNDKSRSYYPTKKIAISEMRRELGRKAKRKRR